MNFELFFFIYVLSSMSIQAFSQRLDNLIILLKVNRHNFDQLYSKFLSCMPLGILKGHLRLFNTFSTNCTFAA